MTLALYGKSKHRQGVLLLGGIVAILLAVAAALLTVTLASAHTISKQVKTPTCADPSWSVFVKSDNNFGTDYWEVVLTTTSGSPTLDEPYSPYLVLGNTTLVDESGSGDVNFAGNAQLFRGSFGSSIAVGTFTWWILPPSATDDEIYRLDTFPGAYAVGRIIKWDNELMKITAVDNSGGWGGLNTLTVERGFAGTTIASHNTNYDLFPDISVWTRQDNTADDTESWNLNFDVDSCILKQVAYVDVANSEVSWTVQVKNDSQTAQTFHIEDTDDSAVLNSTSNCTNNPAPDDSDPWTCTVPGNTTATLYITTSIQLDRCAGGEFENTVILRNAPGQTIAQSTGTTAVKGDPAYCNREIRVCKIIEDNGDSDADDGVFGGDVRTSQTEEDFGPLDDLGQDFNFPEQQEGSQTLQCDTIEVPKGGSFELVEWKKPAGWDDAPGYPKYQVDDGPILSTSGNTTGIIDEDEVVDVVFLINREEPSDRDIEIHKFFLNTGPYTPTEADLPPIEGLPNGAVLKDSGFVDSPDNTHYRWVYTIPFDADTSGIDEGTPPNGWLEVTGNNCVVALNGLGAEYNAQFEEQVALQRIWVFCNVPYGTLIINKTDGTSDGSTLWDFTVDNLPSTGVDGVTALDNTPQASENTPSSQTLIPLGAGALFVEEVDFRLEAECAEANTYFSAVIAPNPDQTLDFPGDTVVWNFSNQPCGVLGTGGILIEKWEDVNGDGIISAGDQRLPGWTFTTTGGGIPGPNQVRVTNASGQITEYISGFDAGTVLTTSETLQPGWVFVGSDVDGGPMTNDASPDVVIVGGETIIVRFLNERARVNIVATKTIFNNANPAGANGGAGWTFTLTGCGIAPSQKTTDASGSVSWNNLPAAINCTYTVTETQKAGWVADQISRTAAPINDGETVTLGFINRQIEGCVNINDCPQTFDETPTPTNTPVTPTNTPETGETPTTEPTATNTPDEDIAGERTPGPGDPTPQAPDTGAGLGSTAAGWNILLIIAGLIAISGGLSMIAIGRRPVRQD